MPCLATRGSPWICSRPPTISLSPRPTSASRGCRASVSSLPTGSAWSRARTIRRATTTSTSGASYTASWEALVAGLRALHLELLLPLEQHSRILTAVLEPSHPNYSFQTMHDELYARGFTIYPGIIPDLRTFRLANLGAIDRTDIEAFLEVLRTYLDEHGIL